MSLWRALTMTFPLAPHGDWSRRGLLSSSTMTLIWHLNSSCSHLGYSYNPWLERTTCFPMCLELSNQGPPGDYMSLLLYCRFHSQTMGYIILEWCAYIYFHDFISAMAAVQQQNNLYTAYITEARAFAELVQGEITSWYGYDYQFESMPFWKARHQHVDEILSDIN